MKRFPYVVAQTAVLAMVTFGCGAVMAQNEPAPAAPEQNEAAGPAAPAGSVSRSQTQMFVSQAAHANNAEIADGRYALAHTRSPDVRQFAQKMIDDHTMAGDMLKQTASGQGYKVPDGLSRNDRAAMDRLKQDTGATFDAAYARSQVRDHEKVVAMFKRAEQNQKIDPQVRDFVRMTLPVLEGHLQMATKLAASERGGNHSAD